MIVFECVLIINKNVNEIGFKNKILSVLDKRIITYDYLGVRKLAYKIQEQEEAKYISFKFTTHDVLNTTFNEEDENNFIHDLELKFRTWNEILKFIIVRCE